jgi:hypothetical protein
MHAHSETDAVLQCNLVVQAFILEVQLVHCTVAVFSQARTDSHLIICHSHVVSYAYGCFNTLPVEQCNNTSRLMHILSACPYLGKIVECITRLYSTITIQSTAISTAGTTRCIQLLLSGKSLQ